MSLSDRQVNGLMRAFIERKKFEAKITMSIVADALAPKPDKPASLANLAALGFGIRGTEKLS